MKLALSGLYLFQFNGLYLGYIKTVLSNTSAVKDGSDFSLQTQISGLIVQLKHVIELLYLGVVPPSLHKTIQTSNVVFT